MAIVPPGGLILVTGANGYIASVTVKVLIDRGYRVRGAVRSAAPHKWMEAHHGSSFSLVEVPDMAGDNAYDEAVKGVDGVLHMAANVNLDPTVETIVESATKGAKNILQAANKEPSVKRVVFTSSQAAATVPTAGVPYRMAPDVFNTAAVEAAKLPHPEGADPNHRAMVLYAAAKTLAEQEAHRFVREQKPAFVVNYVLPNVNIGTVVSVKDQGFGSSGGLIYTISKGYGIGPMMLPSQWMVDVEDTALLHLAGLTLEDVQNERLFAFAEPYSWTKILEFLHQRWPERKSMLQSVDEPALDKGTVENGRANELLKRMGKKEGFTSLEDMLVKAMEKVIEADSIEVPKSRLDAILEAMAGPQ